jgi:hypothetical protein
VAKGAVVAHASNFSDCILAEIKRIQSKQLLTWDDKAEIAILQGLYARSKGWSTREQFAFFGE